jgi:hypothetical protein
MVGKVRKRPAVAAGGPRIGAVWETVGLGVPVRRSGGQAGRPSAAEQSFSAVAGAGQVGGVGGLLAVEGNGLIGRGDSVEATYPHIAACWPSGKTRTVVSILSVFSQVCLRRWGSKKIQRIPRRAVAVDFPGLSDPAAMGTPPRSHT